MTLGLRFFILPFTSRKNLTIDAFSGLGLRVRYENRIVYGYTNGYPDVDEIEVYPEPRVYNSRQVLPSIQMGVKLGFAWWK